MNKIELLRITERLTLEEFAAKIDVSPEDVIRWERNEEDPPLEVLKRISSTFHCSIKSIVPDEETLHRIETLQDYREKPAFIPIHCPICGRREIAYVSEHHVAFGWRLIEKILKVVLFICVLSFISDAFDILSYEIQSALSSSKRSSPDQGNSLTIAIFTFIFICIAHANRLSVESKTHVQCICKECGYTWLHT